jgi:hypothetical protein
MVADAVPLSDILRNLLVNYRVQGPRDTRDQLGLLLQLERAIDQDPNETGRVYHMRPNYRSRRGVGEDGKIVSIGAIQQGPTRADGGYSYPGDREFKDRDRVNVHVNFFDITEGDDGVVGRASVPILTVWVPKRLEAEWLTQEQGPSDDDAN